MPTRAELRVSSQIASELRLDANDIHVTLEHGEVTLYGSVDDHHTKHLAGELAKTLEGTRQVHNRLAVRPDWGEERRPLETEFASSSAAKAATSTRFKIRDAM
jgi:hypothetical protein